MSGRSPQRPSIRGDLSELVGYHSPQLDVSVRLNTNEAPGSPPDAWRAEFTAALAELDWHRYPDRAAMALRQAIADHHGVPVARVFAANGSNEVLQTLCLTFGGSGRSVGLFEPTYALHAHIAHLTATAVIEGERRDDFTLDPTEVDRVVSDGRPVITYLCSPNNPTGIAETTETILATLERVESIGGLLIVDEAYGQFAPETAVQLVDDERSLAVSRTFSKTWSMAAARLGYLVAPTWVVDELEKVVLPYHLDAPTQLAGVTALAHATAMGERVGAVVEERERVVAVLSTLAVHVWPSDANFVLFRPDHGDGEQVWQGLVDRSVLVRNCASWPRLDGCLRVTIGTPNENDRFLTALAEVLGSGASVSAGRMGS